MDICEEKMNSPWEVPTHFKTVYEYFWIILPNLVKMRNMFELGKYKLKFSGYSIWSNLIFILKSLSIWGNIIILILLFKYYISNLGSGLLGCVANIWQIWGPKLWGGKLWRNTLMLSCPHSTPPHTMSPNITQHQPIRKSGLC